MMKTGKTLEPYDISIDVWKCLGNVVILWLTMLFSTIFQSNKMPD
jgi:hypothetical protein